MKLSILSSIENDSADAQSFAEQSSGFLRLGTLASALGYSTLFVFKNSANRKNLVSDPLLLQAAMATQVGSLRLGVGFAPLSYFDPIALAENCATLDVLSGGRLTVAVDDGAMMKENQAIDLSLIQQENRVRENRELLRMALTGRRFSAVGTNRRMSNLQIAIQPRQTPHPPIHMAVYDRQSARMAGSSGFRIFIAPLAALQSPSDVSGIVEAYRDAQELAGATARDDDIIAFCLAHSADDDRHAMESGRRAFHAHALVRPNWVCRSFDDAVDLDYFLVGGPARIREKFARLEATGIHHVALMPSFGGLTLEDVFRSARLFAGVVAEKPETAEPPRAVG
ncbi:MAG: LLM class flavin-dependent oxidoreductase [Pseudomonadota bacterium]